MPDSLITGEVRALIGSETPPERNRFPISEEMAFDVADAIEDGNPLYRDAEYARKSRFAGIVCPPLATWKDIGPPIGYFGAGQESHFQVPLPFNSYGLNGAATGNSCVRPTWGPGLPDSFVFWTFSKSRAAPVCWYLWCGRKPRPTN